MPRVKLHMTAWKRSKKTALSANVKRMRQSNKHTARISYWQADSSSSRDAQAVSSTKQSHSSMSLSEAMTTCNHITHDRPTTDPLTQPQATNRPAKPHLSQRRHTKPLHEICNSIPLCKQFSISLLAQMSSHWLSTHLRSHSDFTIQTFRFTELLRVVIKKTQTIVYSILC